MAGTVTQFRDQSLWEAQEGGWGAAGTAESTRVTQQPDDLPPCVGAGQATGAHLG